MCILYDKHIWAVSVQCTNISVCSLSSRTPCRATLTCACTSRCRVAVEKNEIYSDLLNYKTTKRGRK